ncbi:RHS repeat-associated core domain-containing protein [Microbacterium testaceum]|nr:RHS repeat-associated core domain-containing protein [Microbacterium testaceum]
MNEKLNTPFVSRCHVSSGNTGATAGTVDYTYNDANQLTSTTGQSTTWTYDGAGQQTRKGLGGQAIAYNDKLQVSTIGSTAQTYIGSGNTDRRTSGGTTFDTGALGLMKAGSTIFTRTPDGTAIGSKTGSTAAYYAADHLGSVIGLFDASGSYLGGYSYSPNGEARATNTNAVVTANTLRYIGGELDASGLYELGARYYDPSLGRFTQMDPTGQDPYYIYANHNPINAADPSGEAVQFLIPVLAVIARAVIPRLGARAVTMRGIGASSRLFGNSSMGARAAEVFNQRGTKYALGWSISRSTGTTQAAFRYRSPANPHGDIVNYPYG